MDMKYIIFDMDGTLLDSMIYWRSSGIECAKVFLKDLDLGSAIENYSASEIISMAHKYLNEQEVKEFHDYWHKLMLDNYLTVIKVKSGVKEYLDQCKKNNIKMALATATPLEMAMKALKHLNLDTYFDYIIDEKHIGKNKLSPDIYLDCMKNLGCSNPSDCAVFEDNVRFIKTAKDNNFYTVAVYDDVSKNYIDKLKEENDLYIYDFYKLINDR